MPVHRSTDGQPPIPLYAGTRPYETIPFQWSLHAIDGAGVLHYREFLAAGDEDPRRRFAETLIAASAVFVQLASGYIPVSAEADRLRTALLAYYKRDTLAMVEVHRALTRLA